MLRRERREPARRLLELPFAAGSVSAPGLIPGHGYVHEPLEEVLLGRLGRPPDVLERLVRPKVVAVRDLLEAKP